MSRPCRSCGANEAKTIDTLCVVCSWDADVLAYQDKKLPASAWAVCGECGKRIPARCVIACPHCLTTLTGGAR